MVKESKFNYKDKVFWIENNKVRNAIVKSIDFGSYDRIDGKDYFTEIMYFVNKSIKSRVINWNGGGLRESQIFSSKKELLKSL